MELELTRMSPNGQVVIPMQIRKAAGVSPSDRFVVVCEKGSIILKKLRRVDFAKDLALLERIAEAEEQVRKGEVLTLSGNLSAKELDKRLMQWNSSTQRLSKKRTSTSTMKKSAKGYKN